MIEENNDMKGKAVKQFAKELGVKEHLEQDYFDMGTMEWNQLPVKLPPNTETISSDILLYWKKLLDERLVGMNRSLDYSKIRIGYSPKTNFVFFS